MASNTATRSVADCFGGRLTTQHSIRILIADDDPLLRTFLKEMLEFQGECEVVGEAGDGVDAVWLTQACRPDVVIMDLSMPKKDGLTATAELTRDFPQVRVIVLSSHANAICVHQAIRAGAVGYLVKCGRGSIVDAIATIVSGQRYFDPIIAQYVPHEILGGPLIPKHVPSSTLATNRRD